MIFLERILKKKYFFLLKTSLRVIKKKLNSTCVKIVKRQIVYLASNSDPSICVFWLCGFTKE